MDDSERDAVEWLIQIAASSETTARALLAMAWIADEPSADELSTLGWFSNLSRDGSDAAVDTLALSWVVDGVSDTERSAIEYLSWIVESSQAAFESVIALPWVVDGVSDTERSAIGNLSWIVESSQAAFESVIALPWVVDGVSDTEADTEADAIAWLDSIATEDGDAAARVAAMPFLQTVEGSDVAALRSLGYMNADQLADMLSRPMLKDGITDDETLIVSFLFIVKDRAPNLVDTLLDPSTTTVERRTVELWLAGEVELSIVRASPGATQSMDLLENAVRETEKFMGEPLPTPYVRLLYENVTGSAGGVNFGGTHIAIRAEYEGYAHIIAHEVAHYYWRANADWVDEGMAELMASVIENRRVGTPWRLGAPVKFRNPPCARNLKALEALAPGWDDPGFICNYSLGERLFVYLLLTLGEDAFWEGALNLYAASLVSDGGAGIEEVRQAFGPDASEVIDFWYTGEVTIND